MVSACRQVLGTLLPGIRTLAMPIGDMVSAIVGMIGPLSTLLLVSLEG